MLFFLCLKSPFNTPHSVEICDLHLVDHMPIFSGKSNFIEASLSEPHTSGKRSGEHERTKVSFGRSMMEVFDLQWQAKKHISGQSNIEQ